jgi:predicted heme/steroid binding protein/uncharacterized membrane protein
LKVFTSEDLVRLSGEAGGETLVAVDGKVYDVSKSAKWANGSHMRRHKAGAELTAEIQGAPHGLEVLERVPQVGIFEAKAAKPGPGLKGKVDAWLNKHPFFRRHPHPAVVHFPVCLFMILPLLQIWSLATKSAYTEWAAFCSLLIGAFALPAAIATGYFTWWINYDCGDSRILFAKRKLAWTLLVIAIVLLILRIACATDPLQIDSAVVIVYTALTVVAGLVVLCIGYLGGRLTFPYED